MSSLTLNLSRTNSLDLMVIHAQSSNSWFCWDSLTSGFQVQFVKKSRELLVIPKVPSSQCEQTLLCSQTHLISCCFVSSAGRPRPPFCPSLHQKSRRFKTKREGVDYSSRPIKLAGKVIIQQISCLLPVHKTLGESYM
ncbi:hypothetical protein XENOCAPTIV_006261 [Xenoophorus captivus]|uniref:Uncharacterized protein n=1 Tax=Xenoophorus captivus TaxID=1517983 RepID=A0ABV0SB31_9TELE